MKIRYKHGFEQLQCFKTISTSVFRQRAIFHEHIKFLDQYLISINSQPILNDFTLRPHSTETLLAEFNCNRQQSNRITTHLQIVSKLSNNIFFPNMREWTVPWKNITWPICHRTQYSMTERFRFFIFKMQNEFRRVLPKFCQNWFVLHI